MMRKGGGEQQEKSGSRMSVVIQCRKVSTESLLRIHTGGVLHGTRNEQS